MNNTPKCPKCFIDLKSGKILSKSYDVHERGGIMYVKPEASDGKLIECLKCPTCGHSEIELICKEK